MRTSLQIQIISPDMHKQFQLETSQQMQQTETHSESFFVHYDFPSKIHSAK